MSFGLCSSSPAIGLFRCRQVNEASPEKDQRNSHSAQLNRAIASCGGSRVLLALASSFSLLRFFKTLIFLSQEHCISPATENFTISIPSFSKGAILFCLGDKTRLLLESCCETRMFAFPWRNQQIRLINGRNSAWWLTRRNPGTSGNQQPRSVQRTTDDETKVANDLTPTTADLCGTSSLHPDKIGLVHPESMMP